MVREILAKQLKENKKDYILIDVRTPFEFTSSYIEGSYNIPLEKLNDYKQKLEKLNKNLVFICRSGNRSKMAIESLKNKDYISLKGGILEWKNNNFNLIEENSLWDIERQVRLVIGGLILLFSILGFLFSIYFHIVPMFLGVGLVYASISNSCTLGLMLSKLPFNKRIKPKKVKDLFE